MINKINKKRGNTMKYAKFMAFTSFLLLAGSSSLAAMSDGEFVELCKSGTADKIEAALNDGAFIRADHNRWLPILAATYYNPDPPKVIELLADFGADVNEISSDYLSE